MTDRLRGTFASLRVRHFRILWISTLFAFVGFFMSTVVQSVVAFDLTGNNAAVGVVVFAQGLMMFLFGPLGGAFADRLPKRRTIAVCQLATMTVFFSISWAILTGRIELAWLAAGSLVMGSSFAFLGPARQSLAVELVGPDLRGNAVALSQVANSACRVLGPAVAGALLALSDDGAWIAYATMGAFYLVSAMSLLLLPRSEPRTSNGGGNVFDDMIDGVRYVFRQPRLRRLVLLFTLVTIVGFPHVTLLPGFVENQLGSPSESSSILFGVSALGSLVASILVAGLADSSGAARLFSWLGVGFGVCLVFGAAVPGFGFMVAIMLLIGAVGGGFQTLAGAVIIRQTEPEYVGRVMSLMMMSFAGFGLMGLPIGALADRFGERVTFLMMAVGVVMAVLILRERAED